MKTALEQLIRDTLHHLAIHVLEAESIRVLPTRDKQHGNYSTNVALLLAKKLGRPAPEIATQIVAELTQHLPPFIEQITQAGVGFINFYTQNRTLHTIIPTILDVGARFGESTHYANRSIHLEFVSSNPTGPLHVGHGRSAAYGSALANILSAVGYKVHREYYLNDAGRQMSIITVSVWLRYLEQADEKFAFPTAGYQGNYVTHLATTLRARVTTDFFVPTETLFAQLPLDLQAEGQGDKEAHIDALIAKAKQLLGAERFHFILTFTLNAIKDDMCTDLAAFGVHYDEWFSEQALTDSGELQRGIEALTAKGYTYAKEGALWFRSTALGDEKDRVLIRANGQTTYFAADVAYHLNKYDRGFDEIIDIFGADHHGYVPRIRAIIVALRGNADHFSALILQFVSLYRGPEKVAMSTRGGSFVTLRQLREEVGTDATRFFYLMRKHEQHLDFDLALATSHSTDNPVYYIQYAHARICSVIRQMQARNLIFDDSMGRTHLSLLTTPHEIALIERLASFPEKALYAATQKEPYFIGHYLRELAHDFHTYYNTEQFLVTQDNLRNARLCLIKATAQTLRNGLTWLGLSAPEEM